MWYAAMAQLVEHILGKDEVPGPNPGSSSRQPRRETFGALAFLWGIYEHLWERSAWTGLSGAATTGFGFGSVASHRIRFAYPDRRSASSLARRREWVSSPKVNTRVAPDSLAAARSRSRENNI